VDPNERERPLVQRVVDRSHRRVRRRHRRRPRWAIPRWTMLEKAVIVLSIILCVMAVVLAAVLFVL
jgi:hypothetical protein